MANDRNEKGQFKPGYKGGPGRGNKKDRYPWTNDPVAYRKNMDPKVLRVIAGMVDSSDQKIQREGAKLYIQLFGMETEARATVLDPELLEGFGKWFFGGDQFVDTANNVTDIDDNGKENVG